MSCEIHGIVYVEFGGNTGSPPEGYCYQCEIDRLAAELAEANHKLNKWQRYDDEEVKPERAAGNAAIYNLNVALAESQRHSEWQAQKITSLQDKVDGFAGVYRERDALREQISEMVDANKWEVPK